MKVGDVFELKKAKEWYIQLRHKVEYIDDSPFAFVSGKWLVGIFKGETAGSAVKSDNVRHAIYSISESDEITFIENIKFSESELIFPKYQHLVSVGQDDEELYLCEGYKQIQQIDLIEKDKNKMLGFGMNINSIVIGIDRQLLHKVSYGPSGWK